MTNRLILGAFAGTFVLRVSRPGFNVMDDSLPPECISFDSRWQETMNVLMSGQVTFGNAGVAGSQSYALLNHWLGDFRPIVAWAYIYDGNTLGTGRPHPQFGSMQYLTNQIYFWLPGTDRVPTGVRYVLASSKVG